MPLKIKSNKDTKPKATVTTEHKQSGQVIAEDTQEEDVELGTPKNLTSAAWCTVGVEGSFTKNMGNYESARIGVSLSVPCPHEEIDAVYDMAEAWVNDRIEKMMEELSAED